MSLRYSMARWISDSRDTKQHDEPRTHTAEQRFKPAAAFLLAEGRGTLVSWAGGLPDKQQVTLLLTAPA